MHATIHRLSRRAFTLVELLLVIVIIGVLTAIVAPQFGAGIAGTRLQVEARAIAQAERYARTMALLHQAEVELQIDSNSVLRVAAAGQAAEDRAPGALDGDAAPGDPERVSGMPAPATPPPVVASLPESVEEGGTLEADLRPAAAATAAAFAEAIRIEHRLDRVTVRFLGFTDSGGGEPGVDEEAPVRIRFRSNGTCRPHRYRLEDASGAVLEMRIDVLGKATIE